MRAALASGANFWNGGEFYGTPEHNSMTLLAAYFEKYPEDASKVVISMKGGAVPGTLMFDGSAENTRRSVDEIVSQLKGTIKVDLFECARRDPNVPLETTFGVLENEYIKTGKIGGISLSEVSAKTIHEAVKVTKIEAVEVELSLWATEVLENGVAEACAQYNIPLVAYSPLGRGVRSSQSPTTFGASAGALYKKKDLLTMTLFSILSRSLLDKSRLPMTFQREITVITCHASSLTRSPSTWSSSAR